ncbi:hypothetical protein [Gilvibacter sp.]
MSKTTRPSPTGSIAAEMNRQQQFLKAHFKELQLVEEKIRQLKK